MFLYSESTAHSIEEIRQICVSTPFPSLTGFRIIKEHNKGCRSRQEVDFRGLSSVLPVGSRSSLADQSQLITEAICPIHEEQSVLGLHSP